MKFSMKAVTNITMLSIVGLTKLSAGQDAPTCGKLCCSCDGNRNLQSPSFLKPKSQVVKHLRDVGDRKLQVKTLTFEGIENLASIGDFYNGVGGPNFGVSFPPNALAIIDEDAGGTGSFANEPSESTILFFLEGSAAIMNVQDGFDTGFSFSYTSIDSAGSFEVYSDVDATGTLLASGTLPALGNAGTGDPRGDFNTWSTIGVSFAGTAKSVVFAGVVNAIGFDDIIFGEDVTCKLEITDFTLFRTRPSLVSLGTLGDFTYTSSRLNIDAEYSDCPDKPIGSVRMTFDKPARSFCEKFVPYAVFGNSINGLTSNGRVIPVGVRTVTATPYTGANCDGEAGTPLSRTFTVSSA